MVLTQIDLPDGSAGAVQLNPEVGQPSHHRNQCTTSGSLLMIHYAGVGTGSLQEMIRPTLTATTRTEPIVVQSEKRDHLIHVAIVIDRSTNPTR